MDGGLIDGAPVLSLVVLRADDLEACRRFYELLGLVFVREQHGRGPEHLSTAIGATVLELYPLGTSAPTVGLRLGLAVADLSEVAAQLGSAVVEDRPRNGQRVVVAHDPAGHVVELTGAVPRAEEAAATWLRSIGYAVTTSQGDGFAWADLRSLADPSFVLPRYGRGSSPTDAIERAAQRYRQEQQGLDASGPSDG